MSDPDPVHFNEFALLVVFAKETSCTRILITLSESLIIPTLCQGVIEICSVSAAILTRIKSPKVGDGQYTLNMHLNAAQYLELSDLRIISELERWWDACHDI